MICHNTHYAITISIVQWFQGVTGGTFKRLRIKYQTIIKYRKGGLAGGIPRLNAARKNSRPDSDTPYYFF